MTRSLSKIYSEPHSITQYSLQPILRNKEHSVKGGAFEHNGLYFRVGIIQHSMITEQLLILEVT